MSSRGEARPRQYPNHYHRPADAKSNREATPGIEHYSRRYFNTTEHKAEARRRARYFDLHYERPLHLNRVYLVVFKSPIWIGATGVFVRKGIYRLTSEGIEDPFYYFLHLPGNNLVRVSDRDLRTTFAGGWISKFKFRNGRNERGEENLTEES